MDNLPLDVFLHDIDICNTEPAGATSAFGSHFCYGTLGKLSGNCANTDRQEYGFRYREGESPLDWHRIKFFHELSLAVFIPGLILHEALLIILFGVMAFLTIGLEIVRLIAIKFDLTSRYRELLNEFLTGFDYGKDKDLVITHICLLVGCLWPAVSFNMTRF